MTRSRRRPFEPKELAAIAACPDERGALTRLARHLGRDPSSIHAKRIQLEHEEAIKARRACPAFLPDDGVPFSAVMEGLLRA